MDRTVVRTVQGEVRDRVVDGVHVFRRPVRGGSGGEHRFRAPAPAPSWNGVRDATEHGPTAPMPGYRPPFDALLPNPVLPGDDYLNVHVWTPDPAAGGLPVLVWIHGGADGRGVRPRAGGPARRGAGGAGPAAAEGAGPGPVG